MEPGNVPNTTAVSSPAMVAASTVAKPVNAADYVRQIEARIAVLNSSPQTPQQKEELRKMTFMLQKVQQQQQRAAGNKDASFDSSVTTNSIPSLTSTPSSVSMRQSNQPAASGSFTDSKVVDKKRIQELVKEVDPLEQMDDDVEEMLMQIADDFIDSVVTASCLLAKHRKSNTVEVKDVQLHLERNWNMWVPGFGSEELRPYKKAATTEAHKQRMALIKKTLKKY